MKRLFTVFIVSIIGLSSVLSAAPKPEVKLQQTVFSALEIVYGDCCVETSHEHKQAKVRELIESNYDTTVLIRRAIGRNWKLMNEDEQARVLDLVQQLVVKAYVKGMEGKARPEITFDKAISVSSKRLEVPSKVEFDGKTIYVLYRMGLMETGWQLFDIVPEGVSVVSNYRQQFDDHFRDGNGAELITKLEELLQKDDLDENIEL
ncbi:MAG TPA: hypothetical protein DCX06_05860 [Opitutae bacterium]|mgnify:CR=1 FL=1|nr:hypothetical protein [Opitutae bacterium]